MTQENAVKKRIFSFDLDMTLLDHKTWEVPPSAMEALEHIRKDSVIVIAGGRNMDHEMSSMYCDIIKPDGVIHMNGTRVVAGGNVLFEHLMDKDRLRSLLSYADEHGYSMGISTGGYDYYIHPEGVTRMDEIRWGVSERNYRDGWELMELPVRTLAYIGGPQGAKAVSYTHLRCQPFSNRNLLLVTAGKIFYLLSHAGRGDSKVLYIPFGIGVNPSPADKRTGTKSGEACG